MLIKKSIATIKSSIFFSTISYYIMMVKWMMMKCYMLRRGTRRIRVQWGKKYECFDSRHRPNETALSICFESDSDYIVKQRSRYMTTNYVNTVHSSVTHSVLDVLHGICRSGLSRIIVWSEIFVV